MSTFNGIYEDQPPQNCPYCEAPANVDPVLEDDDGNLMCADCFAAEFHHIHEIDHSLQAHRGSLSAAYRQPDMLVQAGTQ